MIYLMLLDVAPDPVGTGVVLSGGNIDADVLVSVLSQEDPK